MPDTHPLSTGFELLRTPGLLIVGLLLAAACQAQDMTSGASPMRSAATAKGYLAEDEYPDSAALLPPPPAPGSAALALDQELNRAMLELRGSARWALAADDARIRFPAAASLFSCALGVPITEQDTPSVYILMRRTVADVGASVMPAKKLYQRDRPFLVNEQSSCTPRADERTALDGSYPSGHTAAGWAWALIFAEIAPDRTDAVLERGWEYGQSRAVCNVHWQSDVIQGRLVGAALVARLHANAEFRADLERARNEIAAVRAKGLPPNRDCKAEALAFAADRPVQEPVGSN
jgi:acid phosphatase (class A)